MNDDFSFDGANAANMPLDLSFSSQPLPEGEAATGFHLPEITPAQEQAKADSPKLVDEWKQDVQMLDEGGLNGLEESAGLETGNFMDTKSANEGVYGTFRPSLTDMDSVRHQWNAMIREKESLKRDQERKRQNMIITLLRADKNDREAINRMAEHWGRDSVWRLESSNDEERSYMLGMRLAEVLGDGDSDAGFQIYKNTHDLWGKGIISPEQIWQDFRERGKDIVEREDRQRVERERRISDLNGVVSRYVSGEMDSLSADERMALFHAGVSVASMEKARRGVRLIESFEQDSRLYNDDIADDLFGVIGNDDDSLMMLCNLLRNRSRSTANDRLGMGGAEKRADEAYREVMENSNPLAAAVAGQAILNAKMVSGVTMTGKVAGVKTKRSLERALQNMRSHEDARMKAAAFQIAVAKARQMGLSDEEAFEMAGVQEQERRELQQKRNRFFSALTTALEGGEDDYFSSDEASSLSKVGYHLGSMTGDTAPWFLPYAGPLIGLNTSIQRRREEGFMLGLDVDEIEKRAFWFGAADTAEEMIGFHALFKATPLYKGVRKLLRTEKGAGVRALVSGSPAAQYALQGVAGTVEEGILEPTAGYLMRSAINPMLDDERGKQTWEQYTSELSQITSGEQGLALLAFSFGLSGLNYSQLSRAAREFRLSLKNYEALGGTVQGYLEAREEKTAEGFLNKALSNLHDSWMEDPQASIERASAAAGERLSGERIESLRELDAWRAAEDAGMVPRVEPAEQEGMFRVYAPARGTEAPREDASVSGEGQEEGAPSYTLMDGEQMTAYLQAFVDADMEHTIVGAQHLLAGDVTVGQALAQGRFDAAEVITRTVRDEQTGAERVVIAPETLGQMKARADMAMAAIRALEAEGVSYEEAAARMDAALSEHIPLGTLVKTWEESQERIRTEQARNPEFKAPAMDAPFSNAYVTKVRRGDTFRRVLRYARGSATVEDLMEETMEQAVISWQAEQGLSWDEFGAMLQEAQRVMIELFPEARGEEMQFIHLDAGKPVTGHDAIEAFSKIGRSRWLADAVRSTSLPSWLRKLLNHLVKFLGYFKARVELGEMVRQAEEQGVFSLPVRQALAVMLDAGNALYRDQQGDLMELSMERARAQAGLDAMFGAGVATEARTLEDELAESKAQDEADAQAAADEARAPENSPEAQEARREREQARVEALGEPDGSGVFNGAFIEVQEGVRQGFIEKSRLTLCPDVPQFKQGADEQTGVVNPIVGAWQRNAAPISVWRRKDGALQVISGRHRFNACTDEDINCTVYDEAAGFDLDWAQTHDVENNIRDGQASLFEIARYVSRKRLTKEEAVERGIFRKGQSRRGVELGLYGCSDLLDALGNELVSPDDAWRVAMAFRNQNEVQRAGLRALMEGKSWQTALAVMQVAANMDRIRGLAEAAGMTFETDLFGNSHAEEYFSRLAQYAAARVNELTREISSISGASRRPETARKYGVDVRDAAALEAVVKDLKAQRARWQNFGLHEDLIKEANDAVMVELGVKTREEVDRENGVLPLEAPEQEEGSADTGMLQLSQDVSRMLDAALTRGAAPAEDEAPAANFSLVSISSGDVVSSAAGMRARLKPLQGKVFVNKNTGIQAVIEARVSGKTVGKAGASQMSVANLKALGFSAEEARRVHYTAATRIHELFENAEDALFEESYKGDPSRSGAYHFFNTVDIEGIGAFDVNVTAIALKEERENILYTLELTIENPATRGATSREGRFSTPFKDGVSIRNLSSYRSFVEKEKAAVRKKAESDGTFMKAPNGKDTNLTEDQWLSVRTEAFKSWFGDWENDPENASKVVDENGEPRVVYHGTYGDFTVFDRAMIGSATDYGLWGRGFYFTNMENTPYGNKKLVLFLNIRNPFIFNDYKSAEEIGDYLNIWDGNFHEDDRFGIFRPYATGAAQIADSAQERGHDGLIAVLGKWTEYIAFEPNQIKSATDNRGTFDGENPDITFSIASAQEQGLFRDGHFEADNAVITEPGVTFSIAALHASPHSFRKFSTDYMGQGEGAQAYGWGLYFAESEKVNRDYLKKFARDKYFIEWRGRRFDAWHGSDEFVEAVLKDMGVSEPTRSMKLAIWQLAVPVLDDNREEKLDYLNRQQNYAESTLRSKRLFETELQYESKIAEAKERLAVIKFLKERVGDFSRGSEIVPASNYRVELNVDDSELLGWDYVDETILGLLKDSPVEEVRYALERAERRADDRGENVSGKDVYQELFDAFWDGEDGTRQEAQKAASVFLLSSDIKGIRYADGLSRGKAEEEQTYNYVIFNEKYIKITAFADESTGGAWVDYEDPTASFSVTALDGDGTVLRPEAFITRPDGNPDWFTIPKRRGQAAMPVRLLAGKDMGEHKGYGLTHIAASRDLDGLWARVTPERYLSNILANASELYLQGDREILVKGKRPSSWIVLQLVKEDGYYSIVTAHPVNNPNKKPQGKRIPFDGRFSSTPGKEATGVWGLEEKYSSGGLPSKGGALGKASQEAMTADRGYAYSLPPGAHVVNINDVRLRFDDGRQMNAGGAVSTMSLALMDDGLDTAPHLKEHVVQQLIGDVRTAVRRFNRVFAGNTGVEAAAREMGQAQALLGMINKYAARGYRPRLTAQMRYVEVYARMLESGKILSYGKLNAQELESLKEDLEAELSDAVDVSARGIAWEAAEGGLSGKHELERLEIQARQEVRDLLVRDYAGRKLDEVVRDMLNQGAAQLEKQLKDEEMARIGKLLDFIRPRRDPKTGKLKKGLMNADAYRRVARITRMMEAPAEKKAEEMERLNVQLAGDGLAEADHDRIALELLDWSAYGALESMSLDAVRAAGESLRELVLTERNVWESKLEDEKRRLKKVAQDAAAVLGRADATKMRQMTEKEERTFRKFGVIGRHLMSFSQAMYAMSGMPGVMKDLARETLDAVADGHVALTAREKAVMDELEGFMKEELGLKEKRQRADFIQGLKKTIKTGIVREKVRVHSLDLTVEEAQRWISMSREERQAERDRMREEAEIKGWAVEAMVEEDDVLPLKEAVHSALNPPPRIDGKKGRKRERVQVRREFMEKQEPLEASADQLLNVILTYEQPFYEENARMNGYTPEVLDALRRKVGADALAFGYKMRELLSDSGVAEEFERREGVPFPAQANYWMSRFHDPSRINQDRDALDMETGTGTRYGMLVQRVDHRHEVDLSLGASNVFLAACTQQNNYLIMGRMTARWRRLLANKEFAGALKQRLGDGLFSSLRQMVDLFDGAGVMEAVTQRTMGSLLGMIQNAHAVSVLSAALTTIAKQPSALMHAAAFKSPARVMKQLLLDRAGAGRISFAEMLRKPFFQARFKDDRVFVELMRMGANAKWTRMAGMARVGMQALEHVDVWSNCASMTALYNLTWQDLEKENRAAAVPMTEEQMEEVCDRTVKNALELVGQPQRLTQRSMMAALGKSSLWVRMSCYMGSEALNKVGMSAAIGEKARAEGDGVVKRFGKKMLWLSTMSGVEQVILMLLDLMRGNGPDDDEVPEWLVYNSLTGLSGLGLLNTLPILGPTLEEASGQLNKLITGNGKGFIKTGLLDDMLFNLRGWIRCVRKFGDADKMSGEEMAMAIHNLVRLGAAGTGLGRGVNSTMQWTSTLSGTLQSFSAVGNMLRPLLQRAINEEKQEKKERRERMRRW